jgi:hypothetical protein
MTGGAQSIAGETDCIWLAAVSDCPNVLVELRHIKMLATANNEENGAAALIAQAR